MRATYFILLYGPTYLKGQLELRHWVFNDIIL